ncbi:hypothetical protein [Rivibacter subsaxonicus]|uniref:DUF2486 family protein n=1 Tax=Rivibacter subsaxonicus TaxID=457575 RepID=A0A4Q7VEZ3_9BURK|nr:hypothetical protein [Rivibacter subsaxonicus]RZT93862.1 hypothetical protein EV670_3419 [Rivibacter subsaxonicus]
MVDSTPSQPGPRRLPPSAVPTLTEVIDAFELPAPAGEDGSTVAAGSPVPGAVEPGLEVVEAVAVQLAEAGFDEEQLVQRLLPELQRQVDLVIESRLREILAPVLERAAQTVVAEARDELATALRELLAQVVEQEVARRR